MQSHTHDVTLYKAWAWLETNKKQVGTVLAAAVFAGLIVWFMIYRHDQKKADAGAALSKVVVNNALQQQQTGTAASENPDAYLKVASNYPNSTSGARALLLGAAALFTDGKYADAQAQFERFVRQYGDHPLMSQALLGIAACLDAQDKTNEAVSAYRNIIDRHPGQPGTTQAKVALARLYEGQNKPELAMPLLEEVTRNDPYGSLGAEAGLRLEELKIKHPNLVPPVAVATNVPTPIVIRTNAAPSASPGTPAPTTASGDSKK